MSKPENGAEQTFFVLGQLCIRIHDWNEHYIKDNAIEDIIVFDVSHQKYYNWKEFVDVTHDERATLDITPDENARRNIRRLKYKCYFPVLKIPMKKALKTKKKIENKYVCTPSSK